MRSAILFFKDKKHVSLNKAAFLGTTQFYCQGNTSIKQTPDLLR